MNSLLLVLLPLAIPGASPGPLIVAGGGRMPAALAEKALSLAGGKDARVLIIPQASRSPGAPGYARRIWQRAGAQHIEMLDINDVKAAARAIRRANLIWLGGGMQDRLMAILEEKGLVDPICERCRQGAVVGGTSAGAAILSRIMLVGLSSTGGRTAREMKGLGLLPDLIIDTHYRARKRTPRLTHAVQNHADKLGIGIDAHTGILLRGSIFEVIGESTVSVVVIEMSKRAKKAVERDLRAGMKFDLERRSRIQTAKK
jgi:cyanophycinase